MNYKEIVSLKQLANYLRCEEEFLQKAISAEFNIIDSDTRLSFNGNTIDVHKFHIKKKGRNGGYRTVHAVDTFQLEATLKILNNYLSGIYIPDDSVHGFVSGRNTKSNAEKHLAKKTVLSVDIKNFFESISAEMVMTGLESIGFQSEAAKWISKITTLNGHLVQGFNTSPTLANIVVYELDHQLKELCGDAVTYTRYADDLYFSSNHDLPSVESIRSIIERFGFRLNDDKTVIMNRGRKQYVTGLTVFDAQMPRIPKRIKRNLRLEIHKIKQHGYAKHAIRRLKNKGEYMNIDNFGFEVNHEIIETQHRLFGWLHYMGSIEPAVASKLYKKLKGARK